MIFYVFNFLKSNFWKVWKINLSQFWIPYGLNNHKVSPGSMTKRVVSHFDYNTITFNVKCDQIIVSWTYLTHLGEIRLHWTSLQWKKWYEIIILINITIFCEWNMSNHVSLHEETEFEGDRYDSIMSIVLFCDWTASRTFNWTPCIFRAYLGLFIR